MALSAELQGYVNAATTSSASDVLMKRGIHGYMRQRIRPLDMKSKMFGPAITVERLSLRSLPQERRKSNAMFIDTVEGAAAGSVLVFNGDPENEAALWGGLMAAAGHRNKLAGIVADGPIRDPLEIIELSQPCFCTGSISCGQAGILALSSVGAPVDCGGVVVHSGDFVFGDSNGVVVIPKGMEVDVLREAADVERGDQEAARLILGGLSLNETMKRLGRL